MYISHIEARKTETEQKSLKREYGKWLEGLQIIELTA